MSSNCCIKPCCHNAADQAELRATMDRTPHKHAAVIKAWADGAIIQRQASSGAWVDTANNRPGWHDDIKYRVKPAPKRTIGYRRYITKSGKPYHLYEGESANAGMIESRYDFVRWIDTEWQYYEWEE